MSTFEENDKSPLNKPQPKKIIFAKKPRGLIRVFTVLKFAFVDLDVELLGTQWV